MPLVLRAVIAWAAASATGLALIPVAAATIASAALATVAVFLLWRRTSTPAALLIVAAAGLQLGAELHASDVRCLAAARRAAEWRIRIDQDAEPGAFVRGRLDDARCTVRVSLAVRWGRAEAGAQVRVHYAEPSGSDQGLQLREARIERVRPAGPLARWRSRVAARLDRDFGPDAGLAKALLIADTRGLAVDLRERFADAGLVHILSISGLHVAIVGGALLLVFGALRLGAGGAQVAAVLVTVSYVIAIGAPPPAVRSATLFAATSLARLLQRPSSPWGAFALGAAVPLLDPRVVLDLGWQLSVGGYAAVIVAGRAARRLLPEGLDGWRRTLGRELIAGLLTAAATAPLVAWHFGRLSLVAPAANLFAAPIVSLLQPALFLTMVVPGDVPGAFAADAAKPLMRLLDLVASYAAGVPGAAITVSPTLATAILLGSASTALLVAGWSRHWRAPLAASLAAIGIALWVPDAVRGTGRVELHLIDVGQGDAIAVRTPAGRWILVDAGRAWSGGDAGRATVIPYLRRRGGGVAMLILSHPHADHIGGAASVIEALAPGAVYDAAYPEPSQLYRGLLAVSARTGTHWQRVRAGAAIDVDGVSVVFLAPDSAWTASLGDPNEASTVVRIGYGEVRFLLTGDAEGGEEGWLLAHDRGALGATVLKVAHHGSTTSTTPAFLEAVAPRVALVSVGTANMYGHPGAEVMRRLRDAGATILRTDQLGTIVLRTDGHALDIEAAGARWPVALRLPAPR